MVVVVGEEEGCLDSRRRGGNKQVLKFPTSVYPKVRVCSGIQPFCMEFRAGEFGGVVSLFQSVAG